MGFRFRKSIKIGKHARVNLSKSGVGFSVGGKGVRVTKKAKGGIRTTTSIPGTGISFTSETHKSRGRSVYSQSHGCLWWCLIGSWIWMFYIPVLIIKSVKRSPKSKTSSEAYRQTSTATSISNNDQSESILENDSAVKRRKQQNVGIVLLIIGIIGLLGAFTEMDAGSRVYYVLTCILFAGAGIFLMVYNKKSK